MTLREDRHRTRAWGLFGGHPAPLAKAEIRHANGEHKTIPSKGVFSLRAGDRVRCWIAGGAGYGDPLARPSSTVLQDVIDRKISLAAARDEYGVVIDPKTRTIDETATAELPPGAWRGSAAQSTGRLIAARATGNRGTN